MVTRRTTTIVETVEVEGNLERIGRFAVAGSPQSVAMWLREAADAAAAFEASRIEAEMLVDGRLILRATTRKEET